MSKANEKNEFQNAMKREILAEKYSKEERKAFLSAITKAAGSIEFVKGRMNLAIYLADFETAMQYLDALKSVFPAEFELTKPNSKSAHKGNRNYTVTVPSIVTSEVLSEFGLMEMQGDTYTAFCTEVPSKYGRNRDTAAAYLAGLFLISGSIYVPAKTVDDAKKEGYHFEYSLNSEDYAESVASLISAFGAKAKRSERGQNSLVYLKDKDEILALLGGLSLGEAALQLKGIIDERETANSINRAVICEAANLDKTYTAASKQLLAIGTIEDGEGLDSLTPELKETAEARLAAPQISLQQLADEIGITKSCLNHRLRRLTEIADEINAQEDKEEK